ncbi:MAG TPA: hypothetical protein ENG83_11250 [Nitrospirae bacterium]|nr:hypothetical protein [Nitrospirota bacterium]HDZ00059.1 hypothetical protein [Nitrospirota bacterium]
MKVSGKSFAIPATICFLFIIVFILVEGTFRIAGIPYKIKYIPNGNSFARFDPELGWSYVPNKSAIHKAGKITKPVHFDENGIRVPNSGFQFDYSKPSILFIGGSFTMGHGLSYEESFVGKFDAIEEVPYQVVNLGVQGYGSDQALLALKRYLTEFNTKIVVYTFIEDHILRNGSYDRRTLVPTAKFLGTKPQFALNSEKKLYQAKKPLLYKDYLHSYVIDFLKIRLGGILGLFPPFPEELTKAIIQEMKNYSNEHGAYFIVLNWRWTDNDYDTLFHNLDVDVIDTMKDAPDGWEKMVLLGGIHPDAQAGDHAARLLLEYFRTRDLLQKEAD